MSDDAVNHPKHYTEHPSGIECIQITEHMGFNLGNAMKYIWRADLKEDAIKDLKKAAWYIQREIAKRVPAPTVAVADMPGAYRVDWHGQKFRLEFMDGSTQIAYKVGMGWASYDGTPITDTIVSYMPL